VHVNQLYYQKIIVVKISSVNATVLNQFRNENCYPRYSFLTIDAIAISGTSNEVSERFREGSTRDKSGTYIKRERQK
jgi:hypothetical protein